ncbi:DUF885 family protein [Gammaproteobacteria bacterium]|nr:DUF885 family protein [Gammaproteobacteria bacterium]
MFYKLNKIQLTILSCLFIAGCQTDLDLDINKESQEQIVNQDIVFEKYLADQWTEELEDNPIFASLLGNKEFNQNITSNTKETFIKKRDDLYNNLLQLNSFNFEELNRQNKLNYQLKKISLENALEASEYPSYYMSLNQRGGVQSYYETGDRLVYETKQDYEDWLIRLSKYAINIVNTRINLEEGLSNNYTQPKLVTEQVIAQIDNILNSNIDDNPYLKIFYFSQ